MSTDRQRDEGTDADVRGPDRVDFGETLLEVDGLTKHFTNEGGFLGNVGLDDDGVGLSMEREWVRAVDDVSFEIEKGETLGLVGESGCGKSTLARTLLQLIEPTDGDVYFKGENLAELPSHELRERRKDMQIIFQDPQSSLDPRMKVGPIVEEPMQAHGLPESDPEVATAADVDNATGYRVDVDVDDDIDAAVAAADGVARVPVRIRERETDEGTEVVAIADRQDVEATATVDEAAETVAVTVSLSATKAELRQSRAKELLEKVGLDPQHYNRYPHQFSGGSTWRGRCRSTPTSSSVTSRRAHSTPPSRRRY
jgi:ABC-type oligopeptide transport system ATPase subunit